MYLLRPGNFLATAKLQKREPSSICRSNLRKAVDINSLRVMCSFWLDFQERDDESTIFWTILDI